MQNQKLNFIFQTVFVFSLFCVLALAVRPSVRPDFTTTETPSIQEDENSVDENTVAPTYNISCKKSSNINGAFNFEDCKIVMTSGTANDTSLSRTEQRMGGISIHGISPSDRGDAHEITQTGVINISPFGRIFSIYPGITNVNDTMPKK